MATWDDVARLALAMPQATERVSRDMRQWCVKDKLFVWERPLRKTDLTALGDAAPGGPILGARVEHLVAKEALLADDPDVFFTTPHFDGYPAVLVRLDRISVEDLTEVVAEAWLNRAPKRLVKAYLDETPARRGVNVDAPLAATRPAHGAGGRRPRARDSTGASLSASAAVRAVRGPAPPTRCRLSSPQGGRDRRSRPPTPRAEPRPA